MGRNVLNGPAPDALDLGDVAAAVELYRELYERLLDYGPTAGAPA